MWVYRVRVLIILLSFFLAHALHGGIRSALDAIKIIKVKSLEQKIVDKHIVVLSGDVEVLLDYKIHILADYVEIDKDKQTVVARPREGETGFVKLENPDFVMLAERIELDLGARTGFAKHLKIHVKEGFLSSDSARKVDDQTWKMERITYTSCDHATPHWAFAAHKAILYKNSVLKASGLLFKIKGIPVFAFPGLVFPLQNRAGSGFLIPRLSFDARLGFGLKQEYYWFIGPHNDTTIGFHLIEKKGFVLSDEFRWARSPENFFIATGNYAEEWDALLEKKGRIISATDKHYWVQGNYFQPFALGGVPFQGLFRFDFGTDKRIGYHFLNDTEQVEDSFFNTAIARHRDEKNMINCLVQSERTSRRQFFDLSTCNDDDEAPSEGASTERKREREERVVVHYLPRFEWNKGYFKIFPNKHMKTPSGFELLYRHDLLIDNAFLESRDTDKFYVGDYVEQTTKTFPAVDIETARFLYRGRLRSSVSFLDQNLSCFVDPYLQLRSSVKNGGRGVARHKGFFRYGAEWALPERMLASSDYSYSHYMQPLVRWAYLPKFYQNGWYYIDKYDRLYPENRVEFVVQNSWQFDFFDFDLHVTQGYDFYDRSDIFPLRRCYNQKHLTPLQIHAAISTGIAGAKDADFSVQTMQEYSWSTPTLLQAEVLASLSWGHQDFEDCGKYDFFLAYLYQKDALQNDRELFSDVPIFIKCGGTIPLTKELRVHYHGHFSSKPKNACRSTYNFLDMFNPLLHSFHLNYNGHCWGFSLGFEEKRYRQYGKWKSERAITFSLRLESIGSFAQKFRRPHIYKAPRGYKG